MKKALRQKSTPRKTKPKTGPKGLKLDRFRHAMIKTIENGECKSPTDIVLDIYNCRSRSIASTIASENMKKLNLNIRDLMHMYQGLSDEDDMRDLAELRKGKRDIVNDEGEVVEVSDNLMKFKALELTCKLKGHLSQNHFNTTINNTKIENNTKVLNNVNIEELHGNELLQAIQDQLSSQVR